MNEEHHIHHGRYPTYLNTKKILEKIDILDEKINILMEKVDEDLIITRLLQQYYEAMEETEPVAESVKEEIIRKLGEDGVRMSDILEYLKEILVIKNIYNPQYIILKIYNHPKTHDLILEVKLKPYYHIGEIISFFYTEFGEPWKFITSDYKMRVILKYKLIEYMQMEEQTSDSSIIDNVTHDWGDNDDVNQHIGNG